MCLRLPGMITVGEAARLRDTTRDAIHKLVQRGRLRAETIFQQTFIYRRDVELFERQRPGRKPSGDAGASRWEAGVGFGL